MSRDAGSAPANSSPPPTSLLDNVDLSKLELILKKLKGNPEVAYVLASLRKGLARSDLSQISKEELVMQVRRALESSPTILKAIADYRG